MQIDTCRKVENVLKRFDRKGTHAQVLPFHAAVTQESRLANIKEFTSSKSDEVSQFLVCTDRYFICFLCRTYLYCFDRTSVMVRLLTLLLDGNHNIVTFMSLNFFLAEHHVESTLLGWIMLYSLTSHVIQVNMCAVLEEPPEVLEGRVRHSFLWLASKFPLHEK